MTKAALATVAAGLVLAAPAAAKGPVSLELCGMTGCVTVGERQDAELALAALNWVELELVSMPPPAPYYEVDREAHWLEGEDPLFYVPSADALRVGSSWLRLDARLAGRFRRAVRALEPWPWTRLGEVSVAGRKAQAPALYEPLFGRLEPAQSPPLGAERVPIAAHSWIKRPEHQLTPWTNGHTTLEWYPAERVLYRDGEWFHVPAWLAERIERDARGLPPAIESASEPAVPWGVVAGSLAACALAVAASLLLVSRVRRRARALA